MQQKTSLSHSNLKERQRTFLLNRVSKLRCSKHLVISLTILILSRLTPILSFSIFNDEAQQKLNLTDLKLVYMISDFIAENIAFWKTQPNLQPDIKQGYLGFVLYDLKKSSAIQLRQTICVLDKNNLQNSLIVIANYVFDSLCHDFFK